jgi:hypothetical protein
MSSTSAAASVLRCSVPGLPSPSGYAHGASWLFYLPRATDPPVSRGVCLKGRVLLAIQLPAAA